MEWTFSMDTELASRKPFESLEMCNDEWTLTVFVVLRLTDENAASSSNTAFWKQELQLRQWMRSEYRMFFWHWTWGLIPLFYFAETFNGFYIAGFDVGMSIGLAFTAAIGFTSHFIAELLFRGFRGHCGTSVLDNINWGIEVAWAVTMLLILIRRVVTGIVEMDWLGLVFFVILCTVHHGWRWIRFRAYTEWKQGTWKTPSSMRYTILRLRYELYFPARFVLCQGRWLESYRKAFLGCQATRLYRALPCCHQHDDHTTQDEGGETVEFSSA